MRKHRQSGASPTGLRRSARVPIQAVFLLALVAGAVNPTAADRASRMDGSDTPIRPGRQFNTDAQILTISEVLPNPDAEGDEAESEWVELANPGAQQVSVAGWHLEDNRGTEALPDAVVGPGAFVVVAAGPGFRRAYPLYTGALIELDGQIGNGLGNSGDRVRLLDPGGVEMDAVSYGTDRTAFDPSPGAPDEGHSLERASTAEDSDSAADWVERESPTPGSGPSSSTAPPPATEIATGSATSAATATGSSAATATGPATATATGSAVATATGPATATATGPTTATATGPGTATATESAVATATGGATAPPALPGRAGLNEFLPAPRTVDWNQDGRIDGGDEWVEIANASDVEIDLSGWHLDDIDPGGSPPFVLPDGTFLPPNGYLVLYGSSTGLELNNSGDTLSLLSPDGGISDTTTFGATAADKAIARDPDKTGPWSDQMEPSPGGANRPNSPEQTPTAAAGDGTAIHLPLLISEVLYDGPSPGNDYSEEWVEIHNRSPRPVSLAGWVIADAAASDSIGADTVPPSGFRILAPSPMAGAITLSDGRIGNGLANRGDVVRLISPDGEVADAVSYGANLDALDPAVPLVPPGASIERIPHFVDTDTALDWWTQPFPSPGSPGTSPDPVPHVVINEVCPDPRWVDWDANGVASFEDEWIELFNVSDRPARLVGWQLVVGTDRFRTTIPPTTLEGRGYAVLFRNATGIFLNGNRESLSLVRADNVVADSVEWTQTPGVDRVWGRIADGELPWTSALAPSPGRANRHAVPRSRPLDESASQHTPLANLADFAQVAAGRTVMAPGVVAAPVGVFGRRAFYIVDHSAGVRVQVTGRASTPQLVIGDRVSVKGKLGMSFGETQLSARPNDIAVLGRAEAPVAVPARTGELQRTVGRLVRIAGRVERWESSSVFIDDGSGSARVFYRRETGLRRPFVNRGEWFEAAGIVSRYAPDPDAEGGYRLMPRGRDDVSPSGAGTRLGMGWPLLPATGMSGSAAGADAYSASSSRSSASPP